MSWCVLYFCLFVFLRNFCATHIASPWSGRDVRRWRARPQSASVSQWSSSTRRAADNARCGLVRLRRTTMQSKILDPACAPKMKAKWKMEMVDIVRIRKGEWTLSGCFPYKRITRAQLFKWIKQLNICTCSYPRIGTLSLKWWKLSTMITPENSDTREVFTCAIEKTIVILLFHDKRNPKPAQAPL